MSLKKQISIKAKELRIRKRWTFDIIAQKTGLSKSFLCELEKSKRTPRLDTIERIMKAYKIKVNFDFKGGTGYDRTKGHE